MLISIELPSLGMLDDIWLASDSFTLMVFGIEFGIVPKDGSLFLVGVPYISESHLARYSAASAPEGSPEAPAPEGAPEPDSPGWWDCIISCKEQLTSDV